MAKLIEVKRTGFRPVGRGWHGYNQFTAVFDGEPSAGDVGEAQMQAGYDPRGYGPYTLLGVTANGDGTHTAAFECGNNSD